MHVQSIRRMSGLTGKNAQHNMQSLFGTNGEYNKRKDSSNGVLDFANPKRMRSEYFPGGRFDDNGAGPTGVLGQHGGRPENLSKNLSTNQTEKTLYVNIPRFIVPVMLPNSNCGSSRAFMSLKKSVVAGDVVFHLRYNSHMIDSKVATDVNTKTTQGQMAFTINLPTVNYIIMNLHKYLSIFSKIMLGLSGSDADDVRDYFHRAKSIITGTDPKDTNLVSSGMHQWHLFFRNVSFDSGPDSFARLMTTNMPHDTFPTCGNFFGRWLEKLQTAYNENGDKPEKLTDEIKQKMLSKYFAKIVWHFIRSYIKVAGVFIGSDNQGGNDQGSHNPCSFLSTDYVGTIQVAGKTLKAKNLWSWCKPGIRSGDVLGFRLVECNVNSEKRQQQFPFFLSSNPAIPQTAEVQVESATNPLVLIPCILDRPLCLETPNTLKFVDAIPYFLQFGISNQISKQFNQSSDQMLYATNACASSDQMYIEIFMRFNVLEVSRNYSGYAKEPVAPVAENVNPGACDVGGSNAIIVGQDENNTASSKDVAANHTARREKHVNEESGLSTHQPGPSDTRKRVGVARKREEIRDETEKKREEA